MLLPLFKVGMFEGSQHKLRLNHYMCKLNILLDKLCIHLKHLRMNLCCSQRICTLYFQPELCSQLRSLCKLLNWFEPDIQYSWAGKHCLYMGRLTINKLLLCKFRQRQ